MFRVWLWNLVKSPQFGKLNPWQNKLAYLQIRTCTYCICARACVSTHTCKPACIFFLYSTCLYALIYSWRCNIIHTFIYILNKAIFKMRTRSQNWIGIYMYLLHPNSMLGCIFNLHNPAQFFFQFKKYLKICHLMRMKAWFRFWFLDLYSWPYSFIQCTQRSELAYFACGKNFNM